MAFNAAIDTFAGGVLTVNPSTPCRFRFIVCSDFLDNRVLRVVEHNSVTSAPPYAAVSYPWRGLQAASATPPDTFFRVPLEGGNSDPISLAVLRTACLAARQTGADLLWIDQICIMQTSVQDRDWQIGRMFDLYDRCQVSLVLPGGLRRLAAHDEGTNWIERSWTLQEALPRATHVVFAWGLGAGELQGLTSGRICEVEQGRSATMELGKLLQAAYVGSVLYRGQNIPINLFGKNRDPILALMAVKEASGREMRDVAVWRSALLRTCSQPRDMILSIMGIFGVRLDVGRYREGDRERAAVDLAFDILKSGRSASWLGAAPACANLPSMCSMPAFPAVDGREAYYVVAGCKRKPWEVMGSGLDWYVTPTATARMQQEGIGRLQLTAKSLPVAVQGVKQNGSPFWGGFGFDASLVLDGGVERGRRVDMGLSSPIEAGDYRAVEIGLVEHFSLPATAAKTMRGAALLMILKRDPSMDGWENVAYGTIVDVGSVTRTWPRGVYPIGR
jgi:hypothetical protein